MGPAGDYRTTWVSEAEYAQYYETENAEKELNVHEAREACDRVMGDAMGKLASLVSTDAEQTLIVLNPLNWDRSDLVRFKTAALPRTFRIVDAVSGETVEHEEVAPGEAVFFAAGVPSMGYKSFRIAPLSAAAESKPDAVIATANALENRYYKLIFDGKTGGIRSIVDKELGKELVDAKSDRRFNEYLYKHIAKNGDLEGAWHGPTAASLSGKSGRVLGSMTAGVQAKGCRRIQQTVILYDRIKRIDFVQDLNKDFSGMSLMDYGGAAGRSVTAGKEGVLYALPFAIPNFHIRHELAGAVVDPFSASSPAPPLLIMRFNIGPICSTTSTASRWPPSRRRWWNTANPSAACRFPPIRGRCSSSGKTPIPTTATYTCTC